MGVVSESAKQGFEAWAVVELMGHRKLAGKVTEQVIAGVGMLRVDVPEVPTGEGGQTIPGFTQFYGASAVYCLTPCSESVARMMAQARRERPIQLYELAALPPAPRGEEAEPDYEDEG